MTALACTGLGVRIDQRTILAGVELSLHPGNITAVVGPNGAGKSTLLACMAGLRKPSVGTVTLDGASLGDLAASARARRVAFLPQTAEIAWDIEVQTFIALGRTPFLGARGLTAADLAAVDRAIAAAGVEAFRSRTVDTLSGGERARVLIARALAGEPEWLLADEPLTGLDPGHQLGAAALFRRLADEGTGVVLTLHDLSLALRTANRVIVLAAGQVSADDLPANALSTEVLRRAYGVEAIVTVGPGGPMIDVIRRC